MTTKTAFDSVKLSQPCNFCNKGIFLGEEVVITKNLITHLKCYKLQLKKDELIFLEDLFKQVRELRKVYAGLSALQWKIKDRLKEFGVEK
jgi:hypothetical protein